MLALKWPIGADPALDIPPFPREDEDLDLDVPPPPRSWRSRANDEIAPFLPPVDDDSAGNGSPSEAARWIEDAVVPLTSPRMVAVAPTNDPDTFDIPSSPGPDAPTEPYYDFSSSDGPEPAEIEVPRSYDRVDPDYYSGLSTDGETPESADADVPQSYERVATDSYGLLSRDREEQAAGAVPISHDRDAGPGHGMEVPISYDRVEKEYDVPISHDRVEAEYDIPVSHDRDMRADSGAEVPISYDRVEKEYEIPISHDRVEREYDVPMSHDRVEKDYDVPISHDRVERHRDVPISHDRVEREIDVPMSRDRVERDIVVPVSRDRREREIDVPMSHDRIERSHNPVMVPVATFGGPTVASSDGSGEPDIEFLDLNEGGLSDELQPDDYQIDLGTTVNPDEELEQSMLHGTVSSQLEAVEFGSEVAAILAEMGTAQLGETALADSIRLRFTSWLDCATDTIVAQVVDPCLRNRDGTETPFHGLLASGPSPERCLSIDCIMVEQLKAAMPGLIAEGAKLDLCLPVSASTLLRPKFRSQYMALWSDMDEALRRSIRLNAYGLPAGAASQSGDLFGWMRSLSGRAPNVRIPPRVELMAPLGGFAVHAVAVNYDKWFDELGPHLFVETLLRLIKQARQHRLRVALTKLPDIRAIRIGFAAGVDYLEISQLDSVAELPRRPVKINRAMLVGTTKPRSSTPA